MAGLGRPGPGPRAALPAWKREILERKRAKLAALAGGAAPGPEMRAAETAAPAAERLVLAESLGPLCENPFMRLESERRRGRGRRAGATGARPAPPLLELCVPGLRTIRADNILIIESAPGFAPAPPGRGAAAEIRATEVVVYEAAPVPGRVSRLLEKFDPPAGAASRPPSPPRRRGSPERARTPAPLSPGIPKPPPAVRGPPAAPRVGERAARFEQEHLGGGAFSGARRSDFLQKTGSNSFTVHPRGLHRGVDACPLPSGRAAPEPQASPANGLAGPLPGPVSPKATQGSSEWKPKVVTGDIPLHPVPSPGPSSATPAVPPAFSTPSPASATPSQRQWVSAATSPNNSFEIRPASKPDMETIPHGDLQARALASLRMNSRNSFVFIPKHKVPGAAVTVGRQPVEPPKGGQGRASRPVEPRAQLMPGAEYTPACQRHPLGAEQPWVVEEGACPRPATSLTERTVRPRRSPSPPLSPRAADEAEPTQGFQASTLPRNGQEPGQLPVTFIDEVDADETSPEARLPPQYHHPTVPEHSGPQPHHGITFTVVPKRKPGALEEQLSGQAGGDTRQLEAEEGEARVPEGPHNALETRFDKRYPTVHEIEVIGGYLALQKSCLSKAGSSRKKMKISFNDKSLQTTFEYPSESSLIQEEEQEAEDEEGESEGSGSEGVAEETHFSLFLPRATFVNSVGVDSPRLPGGSSGLSSYTPKHSVGLSKWQGQTVEPPPPEVEPLSKEVMLTPAGQNDLSDFRSEPALYF
ncbi:PREDICTED: taperin [Elephantulus edwardii]|uniref:taperin n=1 Tax=Elephantulus edwardii TaxID=28737 RepID=UPI0003F084D2|nr:PREDICTED: taperin [Elephantulus edwardii]